MMLLDVLITEGGLLIAAILIFALFFILFKKTTSVQLKLKDKDLEIERLETSLMVNVDVLAKSRFEQFKADELAGYQKKADEAAKGLANILNREWIIEYEKSVREDAIKRSMSVNLGKITEHLIPFSEQFKDFNPQDARFIGSPIDLIVFDGVAEKKEEVTIYFIEVKTGTSALTEAQRKIKLAIDNGRIKWKLLKKGEFNWESETSK